MFSRSKINEPGPKAPEPEKPKVETAPVPKPAFDYAASAPKPKPVASVLSSDLTITGNIRTTGDIQIEGTVDGDIRAHMLTVGESATIKGEIVADDIVVNGRVVGRVRGLKVRLTSTARNHVSLNRFGNGPVFFTRSTSEALPRTKKDRWSTN